MILVSRQSRVTSASRDVKILLLEMSIHSVLIRG